MNIRTGQSATWLVVVAVLMTGAGLLARQQKVSGQGDQLLPAMELQAGLLMVGGAHKGGSNFIVQLHGPGESSELVVNSIGPYVGVRLIPVKAGAHRLQIQASDPWTLLYEQQSLTEKGAALPITKAMIGDSPLGPFAMKAGLLEATFTHTGARNFVATLYHQDGRLAALLVNKIGKYSGTVAERLTGVGNYWLAVQADGQWTVTLSQ